MIDVGWLVQMAYMSVKGSAWWFSIFDCFILIVYKTLPVSHALQADYLMPEDLIMSMYCFVMLISQSLRL